MSKVLDYLLNDDVIVVFDVDGVLSAFEFGELRHNGCDDKDWEQFVIKNKPYDKMSGIPQMQNFIVNKGYRNIYTCSVSEPYEEENKRDFVFREYGIPKNHIKFVRNKKDKIEFLRELSKITNDEKKVAIVEDTVSTLNAIYEQSDFITVHVSSFFFF